MANKYKFRHNRLKINLLQHRLNICISPFRLAAINLLELSINLKSAVSPIFLPKTFFHVSVDQSVTPSSVATASSDSFISNLAHVFVWRKDLTFSPVLESQTRQYLSKHEVIKRFRDPSWQNFTWITGLLCLSSKSLCFRVIDQTWQLLSCPPEATRQSFTRIDATPVW